MKHIYTPQQIIAAILTVIGTITMIATLLLPYPIIYIGGLISLLIGLFLFYWEKPKSNKPDLAISWQLRAVINDANEAAEKLTTDKYSTFEITDEHAFKWIWYLFYELGEPFNDGKFHSLCIHFLMDTNNDTLEVAKELVKISTLNIAIGQGDYPLEAFARDNYQDEIRAYYRDNNLTI